MELKGGRYFLLGREFSGVGFEIAQDKKVRAIELANGIEAGGYHPLCASPGDQLDQVDLTGMLSDYEVPLYQGHPFSGIGYEFDDGACTREVFLRNGIVYSEARWTEAGQMVYFDIPNEEFGEVYEWYSSGELKSVDVTTNSEFYGGMRFSEDGELVILSACNGFLEAVPRIAGKARFFPISNIHDIERLKISSDLTLFGGDIEGEFFCYLMDGGVLKKVSVLRLINVGVNFLSLIDLLHLQELHVDGVELRGIKHGNGECLDVGSFVKQHGLSIKVFVDGREVM
ncbi:MULTISPECIES: hypothetical protein [unclassified Burkholderia]|uniref:hypothetical protein n=1 Tax=unclassified Burkholderia TaxID=2613784 RepID=UPI00117EF053|nr:MULTISPECIES: hypothetical protein [unclassified Burkholderia]